MRRLIILALTLSFLAFLALPAAASPFSYSNDTPNNAIATASRPDSSGKIEIEAADDFITSAALTLITNATFTGLLPAASNVQQVVVEIYRVFPNDSDTVRTPNVNTRANSPSDVAFDSRDFDSGNLTFATTLISPTFTANNSVLKGIFPKPNQTTLGEGPVTGQEVRFDVAFTTPFSLTPDHYFFIPQVQLDNGDFFWLSANRPTVPPFAPDLQTWIRNANLDPDWSRVGTDIVGAGTFNAAFSLNGTEVPLPGALPLVMTGLAGMLLWRSRKPQA